MKIIFSAILLSVLVFTSGPVNLVATRMAAKELHAVNADSTNAVITIPFALKLGNVSEEYKTQKRNIIHQFYNKYVHSPWFSGGFIVAKNGHILFENYQGYSNNKTQTEINANTPMHLASVSKVLTATAVLKLVQEDNLMLDQKVTDWLPKFPYQNITIRMLLSHRSGLQHYSHYSAILKKSWDRKKILSNQDILDLMAKNKFRLLFASDTKFEYCNTNYVILALIV
jgi:CubicO group peptidase (beta-lactamase class C family)